MDKLRQYLDSILNQRYAPPATFVARVALKMMAEAEEEMEIERGRTDAANMLYESMANNYTTLRQQVRDYLNVRDKWFMGNYPTDWKGIVRQEYDEATRALRKAVE